MRRRLTGSQSRILLIRIFLGFAFAFLLARFFFPTRGIGTVLAIAGLLVAFAYVFERIHGRNR